MNSVGHCKLQVPAAAMTAIGAGVGDQYRVTRDGDQVVFKKAKTRNWCDKYELREPEAVRFEPMHILYIDSRRVGLPSVDYPLTDIDLILEDDSLRFTVPSDVPKLRVITPKPDKVAHEDRMDFSEIRQSYRGAAYAVALDAKRLGLKQHALEQDQLVSMLRNAGHQLARISPRLWKMDDQTVTLSDMLERARKIDEEMILVAEAA
ncbi:hypothetical protein MRBLMR1_001708 [Neorhizobium sp. LMR1-1-1.1]